MASQALSQALSLAEDYRGLHQAPEHHDERYPHPIRSNRVSTGASVSQLLDYLGCLRIAELES
jgi:hypothetical protein